MDDHEINAEHCPCFALIPIGKPDVRMSDLDALKPPNCHIAKENWKQLLRETRFSNEFTFYNKKFVKELSIVLGTAENDIRFNQARKI